jgi:hypothetical protein
MGQGVGKSLFDTANKKLGSAAEIGKISANGSYGS